MEAGDAVERHPIGIFYEEIDRGKLVFALKAGELLESAAVPVDAGVVEPLVAVFGRANQFVEVSEVVLQPHFFAAVLRCERYATKFRFV